MVAQLEANVYIHHLGQGIQIRILIQSVQVRSVKGVCKIDLG